MNIILLIVDSLRATSLSMRTPITAPFFSILNREAVYFQKAYATDCWTLPTHLSIFTGRLPSEHDAHFQTMQYVQRDRTIAEILASAGYCTELITRNFVFDGTIPGVSRGFQARSSPIAQLQNNVLTTLLLALAKPRVQRHIRSTGFFHPKHSDQRAFVRTFARTLLPADELALQRVIATMQSHHHARRPYFVCCNLYDVHAPYPPADDALLRPWNSFHNAAENIAFPLYMSKLGRHAYLREGFRMPGWATAILRDRYHRAVELMDAKLAAFMDKARALKLLEDTLVIITSDHGEAFGEHGLYLHDASVYDVHLRVPLWILHPNESAAVIEDVVSTRDLFGVMLWAAGQRRRDDTILNASYRASQPVAFAEHFHYPHYPAAAPRFRQNLLAAIIGSEKYLVCGTCIERVNLQTDPDELRPESASVAQFASSCRRYGMEARATEAALRRIASWQERVQQPNGFRSAA